MHELSHSGQKAHVRKFCGKSFTPATDLNRHEPIHREEKTHVCKSCGEKTTEASTLNNHELIHTCEKAHNWEFHGKSPSQAGHLEMHELIHIRHFHLSRNRDKMWKHHQFCQSAPDPSHCGPCCHHWIFLGKIFQHEHVHCPKHPPPNAPPPLCSQDTV